MDSVHGVFYKIWLQVLLNLHFVFSQNESKFTQILFCPFSDKIYFSSWMVKIKLLQILSVYMDGFFKQRKFKLEFFLGWH